MDKDELILLLARVCGCAAGELGEDTELLDSGLLDSLAMITLLGELEDRFGIELQPSRIGRENWKTPRSIERLVSGKS